ncbi:LacI family DNA-binding transcriptional regulator [Chelatococcus asaccharovorans]|nr:LacI family DNA-binding transcriptional regulator [Chelatococcus asaccharovorans]MBS7706917.1 LacI family DNA-binding transcriptional regulator [Chelatococcus asaccharovorans]
MSEFESSRQSGMEGRTGPVPVRLEDVAAAAGVSTITASRCISNPGRVSERTRKHVLKVANAMGYVPNLVASSLVSARSNVIGVVVPTLANPIHGMVLQGAADILEPAGYKLLLGNSHFHRHNELELVRTFLGHRVDGILLTGKDHAEECLDLLRRSGTPLVEMFDYNPNPLDMSVGSSNFDAGASLGQYLLARGRRHLAYVGHTGLDDSRMMGRLEGLRSVCALHDATPPRHYEITSDPGSGNGGEVVSTILRDAPEVDAVVFAGHQVAVGAIRHALDTGIDVPGRLAIAGFGESPIARWISPSLTTVQFPVRETGVEAGRLLLGRLQGQAPAQRAVRLSFEILSRESA